MDGTLKISDKRERLNDDLTLDVASPKELSPMAAILQSRSQFRKPSNIPGMYTADNRSLC